MESSVATPEALSYTDIGHPSLETSYSPPDTVRYNVTFGDGGSIDNPTDRMDKADSEQYKPRISSEIANDEIDSDPQAQLYTITENGIFPADKVDLPTEEKSLYELELKTNEQNKALQNIKTSEEPQQIKVLFATKVNSQNQTEKHHSVQVFTPKGYDENGRLQFEISSTLQVEVCEAEEEEPDSETEEPNDRAQEPEADASQSDTLAPDNDQDPREGVGEERVDETTSDILDNDDATPATAPLGNSGTEATPEIHPRSEPQTTDEVLEETSSRQANQHPDQPSPTGGLPAAIVPTEETEKATQGLAESLTDTLADTASSRAQSATTAELPEETSLPSRKKPSETPISTPIVSKKIGTSSTISHTEQKPQTVAPPAINEVSSQNTADARQGHQPVAKTETVSPVTEPAREQVIESAGDNRQQISTPRRETIEPQADSPKLVGNKTVDNNISTITRPGDTTEEIAPNPAKTANTEPSIREFLETARTINQTPPPTPMETIPEILARGQEASSQTQIEGLNGDLTITVRPANETLGANNAVAHVSFEGLPDNTSQTVFTTANTLPPDRIDILSSGHARSGYPPTATDLTAYFTPLDKKRQKNKPTTLSPAGATV